MFRGGIDGDCPSHYWLEINEEGSMPEIDALKPTYRVPTMTEIRAAEADPAAYARRPTVVSTFAGGGGSSLGWRMAGFRMLYASEFDEHQALAYRLNMNQRTVLNQQDIREVTADDAMDAAGVGPGELDVLDGSPPCQTFSTAGKRQMNDPRSNLFFEYIRLLRALKPRAFVAENVSGLVKGVAKGMFKIILAELKASGYRVSARVLDAQWLGVPQVRKRVIFVGVREDIGVEPVHPSPLPYRYSVSDACPWLTGTREGHGNAGVNMKFNDGPSGSVRTTDQGQKFAVPVEQEIRRLAPSRVPGSYGRKDVSISDPCPTVTCASPGNDLAVPLLQSELNESSIVGTCLEAPSERIGPGETSERYFQLQRAHPDEPSPTIMGQIYGRGTAGVIHPTEKRKFTITELKRICSFPDDFDMGNLSYVRRWTVMGNAVPPLMMRAVAETVRDKVLAGMRSARRLARKIVRSDNA